ncbi:MAG: TCP-1/cpn60 chaperonin family protein, partial [Candidatus Syntropharchaeales archaeon]
YYSKEQLAILAFADAIETLPRALASNCGMDPLDTILKLRAEHAAGKTAIGISAERKDICDMFEEGIPDPLEVRRAMINTATGTAAAILNIDDLVIAKREVDTRLDIEKNAPEHTYKGGRIKYK